MKMFDDLLSDKPDSDDELPKVSNSVSLDLLKARGAGRASQQAPPVADRSSAALPETEAADVGGKQPSGKSVADKRDSVLENNVHDAAVSQENAQIEESVSKEAQESSQVQSQPLEEVLTKEEVQGAEAAPSVPQPAEDNVKLEEDQVEREAPVPNEKETDKPRPEVEKEVQPEILSDMISPTRAETSERSPEKTESQQAATVDIAEPAQSQQKTEELFSEDTEDAYPKEEGASAMNFSEDTYPEEDAPVPMDAAEEMVYHQQASSIVHSVITNALKDVASRQAEEEEDSAPPPVPDEAPPPLPGAPPPPLIFTNVAEKLVDAEDLEGMLPSQDNSSKSSPRSEADPPPAAVSTPESEDVDVVTEDTISADTTAPSFSLPLQQKQTGPASIKEEDDQDSHPEVGPVVNTFAPSPSDSLPLSVNTDLGVGMPGKVEHAHEDNPPVSDTLSQDSGVQDEDMSEDGLRFSQDDSPTSHVDSSVFDAAMTPDEVPASTLATDVSGDDVIVPRKSPVPSPRARTSLQELPSQDPEMSPVGQNSVPGPTSVSVRQESAVSADGASPPSAGADEEDTESQLERTMNSIGEEDNVQSGNDAPDEENQQRLSPRAGDGDSHANADDDNAKDIPELPESAPPLLPSSPPPTVPEDSNQAEDLPQDSAEIRSSRKWCILDQSGSLFLHGGSDSTVTVARETLRQVSSLMPEELAGMLEVGNKDLDAARLPAGVELRVVSTKGLSGRALSVDVTQREDYFVQVRGGKGREGRRERERVRERETETERERGHHPEGGMIRAGEGRGWKGRVGRREGRGGERAYFVQARGGEGKVGWDGERERERAWTSPRRRERGIERECVCVCVDVTQGENNGVQVSAGRDRENVYVYVCV